MTALRVLLDASLRIAALAGVVALLLAVLRIRAASVRHGVWAAVLGAMLLMPVLPRVTPSVAVPVPAAAAKWTNFEPVPAIAAEPLSPGAESIPRELGAPITQNMPIVDGHTQVATRPIAPRFTFSWTALATGLYAAVALLFFVRLLAGWFAARTLVASKTTQRIHIDGLPSEFHLELYESPQVVTPVTTGVVHSRVLLPIGWRDWPRATLFAILAHEWAHVVRRDPLVACVARLNVCVFWFHPLSWWLERTLATTAEHAADATAIRLMGPHQEARYAEVLLDMAETVRRAGRRVAWQGVGVSGGLLTKRIERILGGTLLAGVSRGRKIAIALCSAVAIFIVAACQQAVMKQVEPLKENPAVAAEIAKNQARTDRWAAVSKMTAADIKALEAQVAANPEDVDLREKAISFYWTTGAKVIGWNETVAARRRHGLWLIAHHPESDLLYSAMPRPDHDPEGYAQARKLWLAYLDRKDVDGKALQNAANFFSSTDKPFTETLLLRGQAMQPGGGHWIPGTSAYESSFTGSLGLFYAKVILGVHGPESGTSISRVGREATGAAFAKSVRAKLDQSQDPRLLLAAGQYLVQPYGVSTKDVDFDYQALGRSYLNRAAAIDSETMTLEKRASALRPEIERVMAAVERSDKWRLLGVLKGNESPDAQYKRVSAMPDADRFSSMAWLADEAYMRGEAADYYDPGTPTAKVWWEQCRKFAQDILSLAPKFKDHPQFSPAVMEAHLALGVLALRDRDGREALKQLGEAANVPPSSDFSVEYVSLEYRLVDTLLKCGERESVVNYLEKVALLKPNVATRYRKDAAAIRAGFMPEAFQRRLAHQ